MRIKIHRFRYVTMREMAVSSKFKKKSVDLIAVSFLFHELLEKSVFFF